MKNAFYLLLFIFVSCNDNKESVSEKYIPILRKLHALECDNLKKFCNVTAFSDNYAFRSAAFQAVLKNTDRKVLVEYEDCYQQLADIEFHLSTEERAKYFEDVQKEYATTCK